MYIHKFFLEFILEYLLAVVPTGSKIARCLISVQLQNKKIFPVPKGLNAK